MDRRGFLNGAAGVVGTLAAERSLGRAWAQQAAGSRGVRLTVHPERQTAVIAPDFMGLGYEISSVAVPGLLSAKNAAYVQLVRTLGTRGVIRIGGNTADFASYDAAGQTLSSPEGKAGSIVNAAVIRDLGTFLEATGWTLIWALNLGSGTVENAIAEAKVVSESAGSRLLAFEIGNEPDLFPPRLRKPGYGYEDYLAEYRGFRDALRRELPGAPLAGPDAAGATAWVTRFAADEGKDIKLLTHHYYREGQNPASTIDKLLRPDPKLAPMLETLSAAARSSGVPYRICEVNSFSGGGRPGVSDTMAASLWVLDYMFKLAAGGCAGVNMETGLNHRGFVSSYSPIADDEHGHYTASPEYHGMLAFAEAGRGALVETELDAGGRNMTAYATREGRDRTTLTLINKETQGGKSTVAVEGLSGGRRGEVLRLTGPAIDSKTGVMLGGAAVSSSGMWKGKREKVNAPGGKLTITLPAASAAIVHVYS